MIAIDINNSQWVLSIIFFCFFSLCSVWNGKNQEKWKVYETERFFKCPNCINCDFWLTIHQRIYMNWGKKKFFLPMKSFIIVVCYFCLIENLLKKMEEFELIKLLWKLLLWIVKFLFFNSKKVPFAKDLLGLNSRKSFSRAWLVVRAIYLFYRRSVNRKKSSQSISFRISWNSIWFSLI